jgi:hypothetical protein
MDGQPPATAISPPCSGAPRPCPRRRAAVRPAPGRNPGRPAAAAAVSGSADTPGFRAKSAQPADTDGPPLGQRTRPAGTRNPQAAGTVDTRDCGMARGHCGSGRLDSRQRNRPLPLGCPAGNGTARCGIGQHRHGQTARSVAWCSASNWSDPDGSGLVTLDASVDPDGSRRVPSDRLDDQTDDQASHAMSSQSLPAHIDVEPFLSIGARASAARLDAVRRCRRRGGRSTATGVRRLVTSSSVEVD